ncbi:MAG: hypothetical protein QM680_03110 [Luteolibacter sp.]
MMARISIKALLNEGYVEDVSSLRRFERKYAPFSLIGVLSVFGGIYCFSRADPPLYLGLGMMVFGLALVATVCIHGAIGVPVSLQSGQVMEKYRGESEPGAVVYVYIDSPSKTFCSRRVGRFYAGGILVKGIRCLKSGIFNRPKQ